MTKKVSWSARAVAIPVVAAGVALMTQAAAGQGASTTPPAAPAASGQVDKTPLQMKQIAASRLLGMSVRGPEGEYVGEIEDLAIDLKTGQVRFAALEFDPGFLAGERMVPIPLKEFRVGQYGNDLVLQSAAKERLEKLAMNQDGWNVAFIGNTERIATLDKAWGMPSLSGASLVLANDVMDKEVQNRAGENIGEIEDLMINMEQQKVHYALLEFERSWITPERTVAVPLTAFSNPAGSGDEFVMDVSRDRAMAMSGLTDDQMRKLSDPEVVAIIERHIVFLDPKAVPGGTTVGAQPNTATSGANPANTDSKK